MLAVKRVFGQAPILLGFVWCVSIPLSNSIWFLFILVFPPLRFSKSWLVPCAFLVLSCRLRQAQHPKDGLMTENGFPVVGGNPDFTDRGSKRIALKTIGFGLFCVYHLFLGTLFLTHSQIVCLEGCW